MPQVVIALGERGVGPDQRHNRRRQQHNAADSLNMQELIKGAKGPFRQPLGFRQIVK